MINNTIELLNMVKMVKNEKKITNSQLSQMANIPLGTINKILAGQTKSVKHQTIEKLLSALSISKTDLAPSSLAVENYGFIKCGAISPEIYLGSPSKNADLFVHEIKCADKKGINLLSFPRLSLTGSTLGEMFYQPTLIKNCETAIIKILSETNRLDVVSIIGAPILWGGKLYSTAVIIYRGKILGIVPDNNASDGYFSSFYDSCEIEYANQVVTFGSVCFSGGNNFTFSVSFDGDLSSGLVVDKFSKVNIAVVLSSIPELVGVEKNVSAMLSTYSKLYSVGVVLSSAGYGESTTDYVYSGRNYILEDGKILEKSKPFANGLLYTDIDVEYIASQKSKNKNVSGFNSAVEFNYEFSKFNLDRKFKKFPFVPENDGGERAELLLDIQANALKRRIQHVNAKTVVLGVSGGLDSTLALIVAVRAMKLLRRDVKDVIAITMPCFGTTSRTKNNAVDLSNALGVTLKEINIKNSVLSHFEDIGHDKTVTDVTFENSQARERTQVLMDYANRTGGLVIGTGDLSELALGWATYNGDHMSMYGVNASIPKTLLRYLVGYERQRSNGLLKSTLSDILDTPVSPELIPPKEGEIVQKTEDLVGPYTLHDFYIYHALKRNASPEKIYFIAKKVFAGEYDNETLIRWLKNFYNRFIAQQFKRSCAPDGVSVGSVGFSPRGSFSMPSDAYRYDFIEEVEKLKP
ncbi:MAG: NAD(+) synthase [Clostridiales bacterium]|nr:NAD(+) synthase [Clostridiales bacterium]